MKQRQRLNLYIAIIVVLVSIILLIPDLREAAWRQVADSIDIETNRASQVIASLLSELSVWIGAAIIFVEVGLFSWLWIDNLVSVRAIVALIIALLCTFFLRPYTLAIGVIFILAHVIWTVWLNARRAGYVRWSAELSAWLKRELNERTMVWVSSIGGKVGQETHEPFAILNVNVSNFPALKDLLTTSRCDSLQSAEAEWQLITFSPQHVYLLLTIRIPHVQEWVVPLYIGEPVREFVILGGTHFSWRVLPIRGLGGRSNLAKFLALLDQTHALCIRAAQTQPMENGHRIHVPPLPDVRGYFPVDEWNDMPQKGWITSYFDPAEVEDHTSKVASWRPL